MCVSLASTECMVVTGYLEIVKIFGVGRFCCIIQLLFCLLRRITCHLYDVRFSIQETGFPFGLNWTPFSLLYFSIRKKTSLYVKEFASSFLKMSIKQCFPDINMIK